MNLIVFLASYGTHLRNKQNCKCQSRCIPFFDKSCSKIACFIGCCFECNKPSRVSYHTVKESSAKAVRLEALSKRKTVCIPDMLSEIKYQPLLQSSNFLANICFSRLLHGQRYFLLFMNSLFKRCSKNSKSVSVSSVLALRQLDGIDETAK